MPAEPLQIALVAIFPALVITAALYDLTSFTIPNWISLALIAGFIPAAVASGISLPTLGVCALIFLGGLVLGMGMFAMNWIGGGDAKLLAAASLWIGLAQIIPFLVITALAGGALALSLLALRSVWLRRFAVAGPAWMGRLAEPGGAAPYGVAIAAGALAVFPQSLLLSLA